MTRRLEAMGQKDYAGLTTKKHFNGVVRTLPHKLDVPLKWKKPRMVFVNSMSDLFHQDVPFDFVDRVFAVMALCLRHTFQVLTKRPERMAEYMVSEIDDRSVSERIGEIIYHEAIMAIETGERFPIDADTAKAASDPALPLPNVWLGTSVENQAAADERIPHLLNCPAAVRFLSCEPLLGPIRLRTGVYLQGPDAVPRGTTLEGIVWVIVGGESGHGARECDVQWIASIIDQCRAADVPVFVKQLGRNPVWTSEMVAWGYHKRFSDKKGGDPAEWPESLRFREMPRQFTETADA
jgi:protein gp37